MSTYKKILGSIVENGNMGGMLSVSPNNDDDEPLLNNTATVDSVLNINNNKITIELSRDLLDDDVYGNTISSGQYIRIFADVSEVDFIDAKVTNVYNNSNNTNTIVECIVQRGDIESVSSGMIVKWFSEIYSAPDSPSNLHISSVNNGHRLLSWVDNTPHNSIQYYQIQWRKWGEDTWSTSNIGGWVFGVDVELEASRLIPATSEYAGYDVYWMEFSAPEMIYGIKAEGWIEVLDGNFGQVFITEMGGGYKDVPDITLYSRNPNHNIIINPDITRHANILTINDVDGIFNIDDKVSISSTNNMNGIYTIINVDTINKTFDIEVDQGSIMLPDGISVNVGCTIKLAPIALPTNPGRITPILYRDKYLLNIDASGPISPNNTYDIAVMGFYSEDGTEFTEYSKRIIFKT